MTSQLSNSFDGQMIGQPTHQSMLNKSIPATLIDTSAGRIKLSAVNAVAKIFKDPSNMNSKTPISLLQEICSKSLLAPPLYEFISAEGMTHTPMFSYKCHLTNEYMAIGTGTSKKRAKHAAALAVLNLIRDAYVGSNDILADTLTSLINSLGGDHELESAIGNMSIKEDIDLKSLTTTDTLASDVNGDQDLPASDNPELEAIRQSCLRSINPVGELIEIAQRMSVRPPDFVFGEEQGPPHNRQFDCSVKFQDIEEIGYGRSKKSAKRQVALKLLFRLKSSSSFMKQENGGNRPNESKKDPTLLSNQFISRKGVNNNFPNLYHQLRTSQKEMVRRLLSFDLEKGDVNELNKEFLDKLASEENFEYKIYQKLTKDELFIFFQFQTNPSIVIFGAGSNLEQALKKTAFSSLVHLILMCSR